MKDNDIQVTLGSTGITVNKNGFGALPIQRISTQDAVGLLKEASVFLIRRGPTVTVNTS